MTGHINRILTIATPLMINNLIFELYTTWRIGYMWRNFLQKTSGNRVYLAAGIYCFAWMGISAGAAALIAQILERENIEMHSVMQGTYTYFLGLCYPLGYFLAPLFVENEQRGPSCKIRSVFED